MVHKCRVAWLINFGLLLAFSTLSTVWAIPGQAQATFPTRTPSPTASPPQRSTTVPPTPPEEVYPTVAPTSHQQATQSPVVIAATTTPVLGPTEVGPLPAANTFGPTVSPLPSSTYPVSETPLEPVETSPLSTGEQSEPSQCPTGSTTVDLGEIPETDSTVRTVAPDLLASQGVGSHSRVPFGLAVGTPLLLTGITVLLVMRRRERRRLADSNALEEPNDKLRAP